MDKMTKKQKKAQAIKLIKQLVDHRLITEEKYTILNKELGLIPESPFFNLVDDIFCFALDRVVDIIGDKGEWVDWFMWENDCGRNGLEAGEDGKMKKIKTVEQLVNLIM